MFYLGSVTMNHSVNSNGSRSTMSFSLPLAEPGWELNFPFQTGRHRTENLHAWHNSDPGPADPSSSPLPMWNMLLCRLPQIRPDTSLSCLRYLRVEKSMDSVPCFLKIAKNLKLTPLLGQVNSDISISLDQFWSLIKELLKSVGKEPSYLELSPGLCCWLVLAKFTAQHSSSSAIQNPRSWSLNTLLA